jgi:hypothetical protein
VASATAASSAVLRIANLILTLSILYGTPKHARGAAGWQRV